MMRALVLVLGTLSVAALAQTAPVRSLQESTPPAALQGATADTVIVPGNVLQGLAESEPDVAAPEGAPMAGMVSLKVLVSKTGAVEEVAAAPGDEALRKAALAGVMGWSYRPYLLNGEPREIQSTILLQFNGGVGKRAATVGIAGGVAGMSGMSGPMPGQAALAPGGAVRVSAGVVAGLMEHVIAPVYPPIAKAAHVQGVVVMHAILSKTGDIEDLQVISGPQMLRAAAEDAARQWKYRPYLLNGVPTEVETTINVNFTFAPPPKPDAVGGESGGVAPPEGTGDPK